MRSSRYEKYAVHKAREADISEGFVWINNSSTKKESGSSRPIVRIKKLGKMRGIYCEALYIENENDKNIAREVEPNINFDNKFVLMSEWYRNHLGINEVKFPVDKHLKVTEVTIGREWRWRVFSCLEHPRSDVFLATFLGIIGTGLGLLGAGLGLLGLFLGLFTLKDFKPADLQTLPEPIRWLAIHWGGSAEVTGIIGVIFVLVAFGLFIWGVIHSKRR